jgi:hypothetical protein
MYILDVHFYAGSIGHFGCPEVKIFMAPGFEIERIVAVVEICEFRKEMKLGF